MTPADSSVDLVTTEIKEFATTKFIDDADIVQRDESNVDHMDPSLILASDTQMTEQNLLDFLRKPILLFNGSFSTTDTYTFFNSYTMPLTAFQTPQGGLWLNKLYGYFGIRFDMRFKLVVNANRFQQGRYCLGWMPLGGMQSTTSSLKALAVNNMHMATLVQRTTVPHVEIDLATQTTAELLVPFASTQLFWPINSAITANDVSSLGYINLYPYSPLIAPTGSTVASYSVYVSLENVKLIGAASPQSMRSTKEVSNKNNGPISGVAKSFARGFTEFASVPLLTDYALGAAWISDRIASVASIFGWSKPTAGDNSSKFLVINNPGHSNVDGDSEAKALSYLARPGTVPIKGHSGTDIDEMDFSSIVQRYAYNRQFNWSLSTPVGNLTTIDITPFQYINNSGVWNYLPIAFPFLWLRNWRGSIKLRFKIVKTEFHSGRIAFAFFPTDESTFVASPFYVNRQIIDIRDVNEVEVIIPYISRKPWLDSSEKMGRLSIDVVDPLVAPASVASSITLLVEFAAGQDMEYSMFNTISPTPILAVPQSMSSMDKTSKSLSFTIGNSSIMANPINAAAYAIGDKVSSFRTLLKRWYSVSSNNVTTDNPSRNNTNNIAVIPDVILARSAATITLPYQQADAISMVGSCYAFWSGGIRFKDIYNVNLTSLPLASQPNVSHVILSARTQQAKSNTTKFMTSVAPSTIGSGISDHFAIQSANVNNTLVIELPQYTQNLCRNIADVISFQEDSPATYLQYQDTPSTTKSSLYICGSQMYGNATVQNGNDLHTIYRSLADDGNFSLFISIPPLIIGINNTPGSFY